MGKDFREVQSGHFFAQRYERAQCVWKIIGHSEEMETTVSGD